MICRNVNREIGTDIVGIGIMVVVVVVVVAVGVVVVVVVAVAEAVEDIMMKMRDMVRIVVVMDMEGGRLMIGGDDDEFYENCFYPLAFLFLFLFFSFHCSMHIFLSLLIRFNIIN